MIFVNLVNNNMKTVILLLRPSATEEDIAIRLEAAMQMEQEGKKKKGYASAILQTGKIIVENDFKKEYEKKENIYIKLYIDEIIFILFSSNSLI